MKSSSLQPAFWAQKENIKYKGYFYLLITSFILGGGGGCFSFWNKSVRIFM